MKKKLKYIIDIEIDYDNESDLTTKFRFIRTHIKLLMKSHKHFIISKIKINEK